MNTTLPEGFTLDTPVSGNSVPDGFTLDTPQASTLPEGFTLDNQPSQETSALGAAGRSALTNVFPTAGALAGGYAGALAGASIGSLATPVGSVIGGIAGGILGGLGGGTLAGKAQEKVAETVAPDQWKEVQQLQGADQQNHPYITTAGALIPLAITHKFKPQDIPMVVSSGRKLISELSGKPLAEAKELLAKPETKEALNKLMNMVVGGGFMGGTEAWNQIQQGDFSPIKLAIATVGGASFTTPRSGTPVIFGGEPAKIEATPATPEAIAEQAARNNALKIAAESDIVPVPETIKPPQKEPISAEVMAVSDEVHQQIVAEQVAKEQQAIRDAGMVAPKVEPAIETIVRPLAEDMAYQEPAIGHVDEGGLPAFEPQSVVTETTVTKPINAPAETPVTAVEKKSFKSKLSKSNQLETDPLRAFVSENGGIRAYKRVGTEKNTYMMAELKEVPPAFRRKTGMSLDDMLSALQADDVGLIGKNETVSDLIAALKGKRKAGMSENAYYESKSKDLIPTDQFVKGDKVEIGGVEHEVTRKNPDGSIILKNGKAKKLGKDDIVAFDKGSWVMAEQKESAVKTKPKVTPQELIPANETPFNLVQESAINGEAVQKANDTARTQSEANAKAQGDMFGNDKSDLTNLKGNVGGSGTTETANPIRKAILETGENITGISGGKPIPSSAPMAERTFAQHVDNAMIRSKREGLNELDQTLTGLKAGWQWMKEAFANPPRDDGLSQATTRHEGAYMQADDLARKFYKAKVKEVGNERTLSAMSVYADAGGDPATLQKGFELAPGKADKQAYADAMKLTDKEKEVAQQLKQLQASVGEELAKRGLVKLTQENYFRRIFKTTDETTLQAIINRFLRGKPEELQSVTDRTADINKSVGSAAMERQFANDFETMRFVDELSKQSGVKTEVETNAFKRALNYYLTAAKTIADIRYIDELKIARQRDNRLSVITQEDLNAFQRIGTKDESKSPYENFKKYITDAKAEVKARNATLDEIIANKNEEAHAGAERAVTESEANLAKAQGLYDMFRGQGENFKEPNLRDYSLKVYDGLNTVWIHPKALPQVKAMYELSALRKSVALKVSSEFKQAMLSFSLFHPVQLAIHGIEHRVNPFNLVKELDFSGNSDLSRAMIKLSDAGLVHSATDELNAIMEGVSGGGGLFGKLPFIGEGLAKVNQFIFENIQPRLKMTMALHALERNAKRYAKDIASGKMSEYSLHRLTAEQANAAFGGINYKLLGRNPTFQDTLRLTLLAPDFLEARGRFVAQAFTKYGGEQRAALALGAATLYTVARIANLLISGRPHLEKENMFSIVVDGKAYSLRTLQGDILHAATKPGQFVLGRVNPMTIKPLLEATTGRDFFGRERTAGQQVKDLITTAVPISARGLMPDAKREEGILQILGSAFGFGAKRFAEANEIYKKVGEWKKANNIIPRGEFIYDPEKDQYRAIKLALSDANTADAIAGIRAALKAPQVGPVPKSNNQKLLDLTNHFYKYGTSPFTGSKLNEFYFVKQLSDEDKMAYKEARDEKLKIFKEFIKARNTYLNERDKPINSGNV